MQCQALDSASDRSHAVILGQCPVVLPRASHTGSGRAQRPRCRVTVAVRRRHHRCDCRGVDSEQREIIRIFKNKMQFHTWGNRAFTICLADGVFCAASHWLAGFYTVLIGRVIRPERRWQAAEWAVFHPARAVYQQHLLPKTPHFAAIQPVLLRDDAGFCR